MEDSFKFCGLLTISQLYTPHSGMLRIIFTDTMGNEWIMILVLFVLFLLKWFLEIFHRFTSFLPNQICQTFKFWKYKSFSKVLNISSKFDTYQKIRFVIVQQYGGKTKSQRILCLFCFSFLKIENHTHRIL